MELNKQHRSEAGLLSDRFPNVSGIVLNITYFQNGANPVLMVRTVNVYPHSYAFFNMECMKRDCVNGGFDLTSFITKMIKEKKKTGKGRLSCPGKHDSASSDDNADIAYEVSITYNNKKAK